MLASSGSEPRSHARRPWLLDLYCGAGGAAMGYYRAGFNVVGVDIRPQPRYPFKFIQADVLELLRGEAWKGFDAYHASPPCQRFSAFNHLHQREYPDLIAVTRDPLIVLAKPYVIENVPKSGLLSPVTICGTSLGMRIKRHREFESNIALSVPNCSCGRWLPKVFPAHRSWYCSTLGTLSRYVPCYGHNSTAEDTRWAMEMPWATREECAQAVAPRYAELIGWQLRNVVLGRVRHP